MDDKKTAAYFATHSKLIIIGFIGVLWIASLLMFILMGCGIYKAGLGIITEFQKEDTSGLIQILDGIELLFVSPLFYLLTLSLTKYISATRPEVDTGSTVSNPTIKRKFINFAMMEIMNVKSLIVGLFISIVTLNAIKYILATEKSIPVTFTAILFAFLVIYYTVLDKLAENLRFPKE